MPSKWAIVGASGFVGQYLLRHLANDFTLVGTYHTHPIEGGARAVPLDITDPPKVTTFLQQEQPSGVMLTAAISDPNETKADPVKAEAVNVTGSATVAAACARQKVPFLQFSTDYVFDLPKEVRLIAEDDVAFRHPTNLYGRLKLAAEDGVRAKYSAATILRIAMVYGWRLNPVMRSNFVLAVLKALRAGKPIDTFTDQYGSPTYIGDIIRFMPRLMRAMEAGTAAGETYHLAGQGAINRYNFAMEIARTFDLTDKASLVHPVHQAETDTQALRPFCSAIDTGKIQRVFRFVPSTHAEGLARMRAETLGGDPAIL
jgi:dTDP-4-dehydrorhamnose reductase